MNIEIKEMIHAARLGGEELRKRFGKALAVEVKETASDLRSEADLASEKAVLDWLMDRFPEYGYLSEEAGEKTSDSGCRFVLDPLDGTNNFLLGIPNFTVSLALQKDGQTVAAVVHQPMTNQTFHACLGEGAFLNEGRLAPSQETRLSSSSIAYTCGYDDMEDASAELVTQLKGRRVKRILTNWSVAFDLCLLASGKIEVFVTNGSELYDHLAGKLIAQEAGCVSTDLSGNPETDPESGKYIIASNPEIHQKILKELDQVPSLNR